MADETEKTKGITSVIHALFSFIPSDLREMVGVFSGLVLAFAVPAAVILGVMTLYYTMQKSKIQTVACWQVQIIDKRAFRLNTCTGELVELKEPPVTATSGVKP
ncbi:MAG: hypothetical protein O9318_07275 [Hylemonella sp.]|uniref:hypothetical protein n=1 Tax=Hylemonella sp. TaxID=2066020 RepID=UPI0022C1B053|nr:hypothetical protein [Hylemonella sp.]MCZ8252254.1 hypothetical protein [Hylemonella sp.]